MAKPQKITQNINKDAGLLDMPKVKVPHSLWDSKHSNYLTSNIGEIIPIYCSEIMPDEKRRVTMGMLSHMTTPIAPLLSAQYTELRAFFVPHRLSADLLAGYKTRKSPWVKVFGEDNASANASIVVPLENQKLPDIGSGLKDDIEYAIESKVNPFGGILDALDFDSYDEDSGAFISCDNFNFLNLAAYELIYQKAYRNQNRESATESLLYRVLFDGYNRSNSIDFDDKFHIANREKDYYTGSQPFTLKGEPVSVGLGSTADIKAGSEVKSLGNNLVLKGSDAGSTSVSGAVITDSNGLALKAVPVAQDVVINSSNLYVDLASAKGIDIETLRLMIKTQELLEKDMMYGSDYASSLNAHFGTAPVSLILEEPLELKKVLITSQMQAIFQTSSTSGEESILGTIGANATTQTKEIEIVPMTQFKEWGYLMICAVHKAQNVYDAKQYKPKHIFKKSRFDFFTPELDDLGYQPVSRKEFNAIDAISDIDEAVSYNEAWAEYRFNANKVHGMFEPSRANALDYWALAISNYADVQSLYKQGTTELDRSIAVTSAVSPQFYDAYGFVEECSKPMKLHSIPGMDGVI